MKILLLLPPFYTPFTPPLGISILKSYLQGQGHQVKLTDLNIVSKLWEMHHKYFDLLDRTNHLDGYSLYWYILNAHMLAYVNNASRQECTEILRSLFEKYSLIQDRQVIAALVQKVEEYFANLENCLDGVEDLSQYNFVGTSTFSTSLASSLYILKRVKERNPAITTLMGGGVFADDLATGTENLNTLVQEYPYVDKIVIGEGEILFGKILAGEFAGQRVVTLKDLENRTLNINESVTPDFSDLEISNYHHLTIEGSRSCPFQCKFCSERIQWGTYRKKEACYLANQLITLKNTYQKSTFFLGDSLINFYIEDLAKELSKQTDQVYFDGYLRAEPQIMNREFTKRIAAAGLYRVRLGMESASPRVLKLMDKRITPENMREVLCSLSNAGIRTTTYWVVGFPGETEEDFQETCNFIRENYMYIYELEAHPYYYYPTGQGISSEFSYESIYPDWVGQITRFKKYDITNPNPPREVRLERLRRLSELCRSLGLINIYSLQEIYQAEERWFRLSPLAVEIYESSRSRRELTNRNLLQTDHAVEQERVSQHGSAVTGLAVNILVHEEVNVPLLHEAGQILLRSHEVLRNVDLLFSYVDTTGEEVASQSEGTITNQPDASQEIRQLHQQEMIFSSTGLPGEQNPYAGAQAIPELALHPADTLQLQINLQKVAEACNRITLIGSTNFADHRSMDLLAEDLYRIYRQLAEKREVILPPAEKGYCDWLQMLATSVRPVDIQGDGTWLAGASSTGEICTLDKNLVFDPIHLYQYGITLEDCLLFVLQRALVVETKSEGLSIDIIRDYRTVDQGFKYTVGPMCYQFSHYLSMRNEANLHQAIREFQSQLQLILKGGVGAAVQGNTSRNQISLHLTGLNKLPWTGGDTWQVEKTMVPDPVGGYLLEVIPVLNGYGQIQLHLCYDVAIASDVEALACRWDDEFAIVLTYCAEYVRAEQVWRKEFQNYLPTSQLLVDVHQSRSKKPVWAREDCTPSSTTVSALRALAEEEKLPISLIYLAALQILLTRSNELEEVVILFGPEDGSQILPVKSCLVPGKQFRSYVRELTAKLEEFSHTCYALEVLLEHYSSHVETRIFDVGYFANQGWLEKPENVMQDLQFVLETDDTSVCWSYCSGSFEAVTIQMMKSHFLQILNTVATRPDIALQEIELISGTDFNLPTEEVNTVEIDVDFNF